MQTVWEVERIIIRLRTGDELESTWMLLLWAVAKGTFLFTEWGRQFWSVDRCGDESVKWLGIHFLTWNTMYLRYKEMASYSKINLKKTWSKKLWNGHSLLIHITTKTLPTNKLKIICILLGIINKKAARNFTTERFHRFHVQPSGIQWWFIYWDERQSERSPAARKAGSSVCWIICWLVSAGGLTVREAACVGERERVNHRAHNAPFTTPERRKSTRALQGETACLERSMAARWHNNGIPIQIKRRFE